MSRRRPIGRRWFATVALVLADLILSASWLVGSLMMRPNSATIEASSPPGQDFRLRTRDGVALAATYRPGASAAAPGVLLLHGNGASRAATAGNAAWLARQGFATLAIDFRGHGESSPRLHSFGLAESEDARTALHWLKRQQHGAPISIIGISLGGAAALIGRDGPLPADAMVLQAVYPDIRHAIRNRLAAHLGAQPAFLGEPLLSFQSRPRLGVWPSGLSPIAALRKYRGPVLIVGDDRDEYTPPSETLAMYAPPRVPRRSGGPSTPTTPLRRTRIIRHIEGFCDIFLSKSLASPPFHRVFP